MTENGGDNITKLQYKIGGLSCSFCVQTIKKSLGNVEGVKDVYVSLSHEEILVIFNKNKASKAVIEKVLTDLGYVIRDPKKMDMLKQFKNELNLARKRLSIAAILVSLASSIMISMWLGLRSPLLMVAMLLIALTTMFGPGLYIKKIAFHSLRRRILNQHVLLELSAFAGLLGGLVGLMGYGYPVIDFFAVATFVTGYHILSGWVNLLVRTKASEAIFKLLKLQPSAARVIVNGKEVIMDVKKLQVGDIVRVKPGERVPIDGVIVKGESSIDESIVTGESIPVEKTVGDEVVGGSINLFGSIDVKVTKVGEDTFLSKVIKYVEEARALKPSILVIVDKILKHFVPGVIIISLGAFILWTIGGLYLFGYPDFNRGIYAALTVLVMGYPCALGMAMPLAMIVGGGEASKRGILIRSGEAFQVFHQVDKILFDKTGTLTEGKLRVVDVVTLEGDPRDVLSSLASAEMLSEHPIAKAIINYVNELGIDYSEPEVFKTVVGSGVVALVNNVEIVAGRLDFLRKYGVKFEDIYLKMANKLQKDGKTVIGVSIDGKLEGLVALSDSLKPNTKNVISKIRELGIEPILLSGDNENTVKAIAREVGIDQYYAQVTPDEKAELIRRLQREKFKVAMVGDGINDAPALMQADVGIAIGTGTDIAIDSSDVIITSGNLERIIDAYKIVKKSYSKTKQNLTLAFLFNGVGIPIAATGLLHPIWAMIAMILSVSTVLLNSFK